MHDSEYSKVEQAAHSHERLYHYTTIDTLEKILKNRTWRLKRIDKVNDLMENTKIEGLWKCKVFVACFTNRKYESYFFWKSYPQSGKEGVLISIDNKYLTDELVLVTDKNVKLEMISRSDLYHDSYDNDEDWGIYAFLKNDVTYLERNEKIDKNNWEARYKYREWDMERETRIIVALRPKGIEYYLNDDNLDFKYHTPNFEYIDALLPIDCIKTIEITLNPWADDEVKSRVKNLLLELHLSNDIKVNKSSLSGELQ